MKQSTLYTKAAKRIVAGKNLYSCVAIWNLHTNTDTEDLLILIYQTWFIHSWREENGWWDLCDETPELQLTRSLALLFMAEIAKETE